MQIHQPNKPKQPVKKVNALREQTERLKQSLRGVSGVMRNGKYTADGAGGGAQP